MAGDWIKIEMATPDKPEVFAMAAELGIDPDAVVGKLVRFWSWCDQQSIDGNAIPVTQTFLDRITHQPGFSDALRKVGWLEVRSGSLQVPHFDRHNGQSAKARAESNRRVAKHRTVKGNSAGVTDVTQKPLQKPLPEKRREEKRDANASSPLPPKGGNDVSDFDEEEPPASKRTFEEQAQTIVDAYPRRERFANAIQIVTQQLKAGGDFEEILRGTKAAAEAIKSAPSAKANRYTPNAEKFFRDMRWMDDPATIIRPPENADHKQNGSSAPAVVIGGRTNKS